MKVNIYVTEDVTDEERKKVSELLGVKQATRDQLKEFMWNHGVNWRKTLGAISSSQLNTAPDELESLL